MTWNASAQGLVILDLRFLCISNTDTLLSMICMHTNLNTYCAYFYESVYVLEIKVALTKTSTAMKWTTNFYDS